MEGITSRGSEILYRYRYQVPYQQLFGGHASEMEKQALEAAAVILQLLPGWEYGTSGLDTYDNFLSIILILFRLCLHDDRYRLCVLSVLWLWRVAPHRCYQLIHWSIVYQKWIWGMWGSLLMRLINTGTRLLGFSGELVTYHLPHQLMNQISIVLDGYWYNMVVPST